MLNFPAVPAVGDEQRGRAPVALRYEDVAQDGRLRLDALPQALGEALWRRTLQDHPAHNLMRDHGVMPILSRMTMLGGPGHIGIARPVEAEGCFELATCRGANGEVERIVINMWMAVYGRSGATYGPPPPDEGEAVLVGRVFAEHVFTKLFAPPNERKVTKLPGGHLPEIPAASHVWLPVEQLLAPVEGAEPIAPSESRLTLDPIVLAFGLTHTDSNQHVNSLTYPQQFEEAVLRRAASLGLSTASLLARGVEVAYRKPSFAGERLRIALRVFQVTIDGVSRLGAQGCFVEPETTEAELATGKFKPRVSIRMWLG